LASERGGERGGGKKERHGKREGKVGEGERKNELPLLLLED